MHEDIFENQPNEGAMHEGGLQYCTTYTVLLCSMLDCIVQLHTITLPSG